MKASFEESQEWEEEESGVDMSFDLETPLEGLAKGFDDTGLMGEKDTGTILVFAHDQIVSLTLCS